MSGEDPFERIHRLLKKGDLDDVFRYLYDSDRDIIKEPYDNDLNHAWHIVGRICDRRGDRSRAISALERALKEWPEDMESYWMLGAIHSDQGEHEIAEQYFRKALEIDPNSDEIIYNLGNELLDQEKYQDALQMYEKIQDSGSEIAGKARKNERLARSRKKK